MKTIQLQTLAQVMADNPRASAVLDAYHIDYRTRSAQTVEQAARECGEDPTTLCAALEEAGKEAAKEEGHGVATSDLIAMIVSTHHAYLRKAMPRIRELLATVAKKHGDRNPKLFELERVVQNFQQRMDPHMEMEERVLFPVFLTRDPDPSVFRHDIAMSMQEDHDLATGALEDLRRLSDDFCTPEWGSDSYRTLMAELWTLEQDTKRHLHVENNVLMPRFKGSLPPMSSRSKSE